MREEPREFGPCFGVNLAEAASKMGKAPAGVAKPP